MRRYLSNDCSASRYWGCSQSAFIILRPFISALLWAVIITYSTSGLNRRL